MADSVAAAVPFVTAASTAISAAAAGYGAIKSAGAKTPKTSSAPAVSQVATAPTQDDAAIARARKEAILRRTASSGRQSTNLSDDDRLGS